MFLPNVLTPPPLFHLFISDLFRSAPNFHLCQKKSDQLITHANHSDHFTYGRVQVQFAIEAPNFGAVHADSVDEQFGGVKVMGPSQLMPFLFIVFIYK